MLTKERIPDPYLKKMSGIRSKESELALKGRKDIKRTRTLEIENKSENRLYMAIGAYPNS